MQLTLWILEVKISQSIRLTDKSISNLIEKIVRNHKVKNKIIESWCKGVDKK